jgi:hypothetical protein
MNAIAQRGGFALQPSNMSEAMQMAEMLSKSGMVPKAYQNKPQDTLVAMMMGHEVGLNPIQSLQNIAVINGKPSIYGDALAALVQNHPQFGGMEESFTDAGMVATCTVWRKNGTKHTQTFSQADATKAGLWGKSGPWSQYPKRMLAMRARGFALRSQFADALAGLITREEAEDMPQLQDYEAPLSIASEVVNPELDGYLEGINNASNMEFLQQAFATSWKACTGKSDREALTRAKDARKAQLAMVSEVSDAAA